MARVDQECGKLDILVNAAGIEIEKTIEQTSLADWNRIFAVNVTGTFLRRNMPFRSCGSRAAARSSTLARTTGSSLIRVWRPIAPPKAPSMR